MAVAFGTARIMKRNCSFSGPTGRARPSSRPLSMAACRRRRCWTRSAPEGENVARPARSSAICLKIHGLRNAGRPGEYLSWTPFTYPFNATGQPAMSVPCGYVDGLPVGLQIVGRRYADADVFAASAAFERIRPWKDTYAICEARPLSPA